MKKTSKIKIYILPIILIALLTCLDQFTKMLIDTNMELYEVKWLIKNVFSFTYIHNAGIAWGMFQGKRIIFLILTFFVLCGCFYVYMNVADEKKFLPVRVCIIFVIAGAIGNMIDRITLGYVIDFCSFDLINFPVFNIADVYVTCSMIFLFFYLLFFCKDEDFDRIFKPNHIVKNDDNKDISTTNANDVDDISIDAISIDDISTKKTDSIE